MQVGSAEFSRLGRVLILLTSTTLAYHISKSAFKKEVTHEHRVRTKTPIPSDNTSDIATSFFEPTQEQQKQKNESEIIKTMKFLFKIDDTPKDIQTPKNHEKNVKTKEEIDNFQIPPEIISKHIQRMGISNLSIEYAIKKLQQENKNVNVTSVLNKIRKDSPSKIIINDLTTRYKISDLKLLLRILKMIIKLKLNLMDLLPKCLVIYKLKLYIIVF